MRFLEENCPCTFIEVFLKRLKIKKADNQTSYQSPLKLHEHKKQNGKFSVLSQPNLTA